MLQGLLTGTHAFEFSSKALKNAGVVPGADMTAEAGLTKLSYLIGRMTTTNKQQQISHEEAKLVSVKKFHNAYTFFREIRVKYNCFDIMLARF